MIKLHKLALAIFFSIFTFSVHAADDAVEAADAKVDAIVMACENQFTAETNPDEDDRTSKINECIDNQLNEGQSNKEDKG